MSTIQLNTKNQITDPHSIKLRNKKVKSDIKLKTKIN